MSIFDRFKNQTTYQANSTKGLFLGAPEAEAESLNQSAMLLSEVFVEDANIFNDLNHEKFIVVGRKGCGKSAIANFLLLEAQNDSNTFVDFVKKTEITLQKTVQLGTEQNQTFDQGVLFQWLILYKMISLLIQNERLSSQRYILDLKQFVSENDSFSTFDQYKITDFVSNRNCEVSVGPLKEFAKIKGVASLQTARKKMPFYEMVPHLKSVVKSLLKTIELYKDETEYLIFFDDLDNDFKSKDNSCRDNLLALIRTVKDFNADFSGFEYVRVKVILLLRDDIKKILLANADVAKIFASYSTSISWYSDEDYRKNPDDVRIKKFIDRRIECAYKKRDQVDTPKISKWEDFVNVSFKDVLDYTFYTPRDLLLFFKSIKDCDYTVPLNQSAVNELFNKYCDAIIEEIKSMLSIYYSLEEIEEILLVLERELSDSDADYNYLMEKLDSKNRGNLTMDILLNSSIVGWRNEETGYVYFKHREKAGEEIPMVMQDDYLITLHKAVKRYFTCHRNRPR